MQERRHILPPQTTALERAVDQTAPEWDQLAEQVEPAAVRANPAFQPWLAVQWQVAQFAPYFPTVDALLAAALPWLLERGNAASLRRALGWLGFGSVQIDENGAFLHIDLGRVATPAEMAQVAHVVRASLPAHVALYRAYHGHDLRPIVLDRGPKLGMGMLDGYSGVPGSTGVMESFGVRRGAALPALPVGPPLGAPTQVRVSVARYDDMPVLDAWRLDSRVLAGLSGGVMEYAIFTSDTPQADGVVRVQSNSFAYAAPWLAPAPIGAATASAAGQAAVPIHPPRAWGGPWGGPWRAQYLLISKEET